MKLVTTFLKATRYFRIIERLHLSTDSAT